ncbi:MAG: hypothetical protein M5U26_22980 [Planctomycetota bacterium]|nr:hypothetical protein [Planctomycetota bacterium]
MILEPERVEAQRAAVLRDVPDGLLGSPFRQFGSDFQCHLMDAQPGDFIRLWHGGSGHSVILVRWVVLDGRKVGIEYRGTQGSTDGIGNRTEFLSGAPGHEVGDFVVERTYAGRLNL